MAVAAFLARSSLGTGALSMTSLLLFFLQFFKAETYKEWIQIAQQIDRLEVVISLVNVITTGSLLLLHLPVPQPL